MGEARTLRLNVHLLTDGRVMIGLVIQNVAGRREWARRLSPRQAVVTPGVPPLGIDPAAWVVLSAAWLLAGQDPDHLPLAVRRPRAPGGATGAHQPNG